MSETARPIYGSRSEGIYIRCARQLVREEATSHWQTLTARGADTATVVAFLDDMILELAAQNRFDEQNNVSDEEGDARKARWYGDILFKHGIQMNESEQDGYIEVRKVLPGGSRGDWHS
jgi:hypothetical protein